MSDTVDRHLPVTTPDDRDRFLRECIAEYVTFGWFLAVVVGVLAAVDAAVDTWRVGPGVLTRTPALLATAGVVVVLAAKPLVVGDDRYEHLGGKWLLRTGALLGGLVAFGVFATRLFDGDLGSVPGALGGLFGPVADSGSDAVALAVYALVWAVVVLSFTVGVGAVLGGVVGVVATFLLSGPNPVAAGIAGAGIGALLFQTVVFLDPRQVDRGGVAAAAVVVVVVLFLAPEAWVVAAAVPLAAAVGSGTGEANADTLERATNGLLALQTGDGPERIPGYGGASPGRLTDEEPSFVGLVRFAYGYVLRDRAGNGTANSALAATVVAAVSPLFLFVPLLWVAGYVFRVCAAAAHGHDDIPAFTYAGRRALSKEGALGVLGILPYFLIAAVFLPTVLRAFGGDAARAAATLADAYGTVGLPVVSAGGPAVAGTVIAAVLAVAPAVLLGYAVEGRLRGAFDLRRIGEILARPAYAKYLLAQVVVLLVPVVVATGVVAFALALETAGTVGALLLASFGLVVVVVLAFVPFVSAALWGGYWHWGAFEYEPTPAPETTALGRMLGLAEGESTGWFRSGDRRSDAGDDADTGDGGGGVLRRWSSRGDTSPKGDDSGHAPETEHETDPANRSEPSDSEGDGGGTDPASGAGPGSESGHDDVFETYDDKWREAGGRFEYGVKRPSGSYRYFDDREDAAAALRDWYDEE